LFLEWKLLFVLPNFLNLACLWVFGYCCILVIVISNGGTQMIILSGIFKCYQCCKPVFTKVRSGDHFWTARFSVLVPKKTQNIKILQISAKI
jgi:hypothetical protein